MTGERIFRRIGYRLRKALREEFGRDESVGVVGSTDEIGESGDTGDADNVGMIGGADIAGDADNTGDVDDVGKIGDSDD